MAVRMSSLSANHNLPPGRCHCRRRNRLKVFTEPLSTKRTSACFRCCSCFQESYHNILTYFRYSYADGKLNNVYIKLFFRNVGYTQNLMRPGWSSGSIMNFEKIMPQCHFIHLQFHIKSTWIQLGPPQWEVHVYPSIRTVKIFKRKQNIQKF
jgi:hypothetical protein